MSSLIETGLEKGFLTFDEMYAYIEKNQLSESESEALFNDCSAAGIDIRDNDSDDDKSTVYESSLRIYMEEAKRLPILSQEEQRKLFVAYKNGGVDAITARNKLVETNLALVISVAKRYRGLGLPFEDLIQEGNLGLMTGILKFDIERNVAVSTYVTFWIRQRISRAIAETGNMVRIPVGAYAEMDRIRRYCREIEAAGGTEPSAEEISEHLDIPLTRVRELQANAYTMNVASLETPVGEEEDTVLGDMVEDKSSMHPDDTVMMSALPAAIADALGILTDRERNILTLRFGLDGGNPMTLEEVGCIVNRTRERVRQIEAKALRKLRNSRYKNILKSFTKD